MRAALLCLGLGCFLFNVAPLAPAQQPTTPPAPPATHPAQPATHPAQPAPGTAHVSVAEPEGVKPDVFPLPGTDLKVLTTGLRTEDPASIATLSYHAAFGPPGERAKGKCFEVLASWGAGEPVHTQDANAPHVTPDPPTGGMVLQEIRRSCLKDAGTMEQTLRALVYTSANMPGFTPLSKVAQYQIAGHPVDFSAVAAYTRDADGKRRSTAGTTILVSVAMGYADRVFLWSIAANNEDPMNTMLRTRLVEQGAPKPWPLVLFQLQHGDPHGPGAVPR